MARRHLLLHPRPEVGEIRLQIVPVGRAHPLRPHAADAPGEEGIGHRAATEHDVGAAGGGADGAPAGHVPHLAVGDHRHGHRLADARHPLPAHPRPVAVGFRSRVHHQLLHAAGFQRPRAVEGPRRVVDAQPHLGAQSQSRRHGGAHCGGDVVQQFRLAEQGRAAAVAVDQRRRAAEVEIDARRREPGQAGGVPGEALRVRAHQLHAHRRAGFGARAGEQLRADAGEALSRQQGAGDAHELGDAPVVAPGARQHPAQDVVGEALHGGEDEAGHGEFALSPCPSPACGARAGGRGGFRRR